MISTRSKPDAYQTTYENAAGSALADAPVAKGGGGKGFGPHELLEAAVATCLNMSVRMQAAKLGLRVDDVRTTVSLDRSRDAEALFEYSIDIEGPLSPAENQQLLAAAAECPVKTTLRKRLVFTQVPVSNKTPQ